MENKKCKKMGIIIGTVGVSLYVDILKGLKRRRRGYGQGMCLGYTLELTTLPKLLLKRFLVNIGG